MRRMKLIDFVSQPRNWLAGCVWCVVVAAVLHLTGAWHYLGAQPANPQARDKYIAITISQLMQQEHLSKHPLDDEMSRRALQLYLKQLDPFKVYFQQSDVTEFEVQKDSLDDSIKKGEISLAYTIFSRFLARLDERMKLVDLLLNEKMDFSVEEEMITDPDVIKYARDENEMRDRWRKRIKYEFLVLTTNDKKTDVEAREKLKRRYDSFAKRMKQTDSEDILEWYITAITSSFDPHTNYMSATTEKNFLIQMELSLEGIGASLKVDDGSTVVSEIIKGGAADKHGKLKPEDRIVSVGQGEEGEMVDVQDMRLNDVVKLIRGKAGTVVRLGVHPGVGGENKTYAITRAKISLEDKAARGVVFEDGVKANGQKYKIGVIALPSFYMDMKGARQGADDFRSTTRDVRKLLEGFKTQGVDGVVLDLRFNGGGSLTEAINLTGLFIDTGTVVQVKDPNGGIHHYDDTERGMVWEGPLVVVTNKFSASASEILAGAIQDYKRGLIVGDVATHGKGTVQSLLEIGSYIFRVPNAPPLGSLKITMQQFYRPNGDSTQKRGVLADVSLPSITTHMDVAESDLDYAVEFDRIPVSRFSALDLVPPELLKALKQRSLERQAKGPDFQKLEHRIARYKQQKERKSVTLNEKKYRAERAEFDADKEDEKQFEEQQKGSDEVVKRDYYFNEVLGISIDYFDALAKQKVAAR